MESTVSNEYQFVKRLTNIIEVNLHNEQFGVNELARELSMSRATLHRKVKSIFKKSVTEFIRETRLKRANELLLQKAGTISEIAYLVGFGSVTYFTKCYHDYFGYPPGETEKRVIAEKHNKEKHESEIQPKPVKKPKYIKRSLFFFIIPATAVLLILLTIYISRKIPEKTPREKTIAVLPFINDSQDSLNATIINGIMEGIINNLSKIHDLTVISRYSTEQYRNNKTKTIKQIAKELDVSYVVEGSGQIYDNQIKVHVQLIDAKADKHLMSEPFDRNIEDIFSLESEIATAVASKIEAIITPEEKELIETKPTKSVNAYEYLLKAEQLKSMGYELSNPVLVQQAEQYLRKAISTDSTYSQAYVTLAWDFVGRGLSSDTIFHLANRALHFDNKNANAYYLKGWFLTWHSGKLNEAEDAYKHTIKYNRSHSKGYDGLGDLMWIKGDYAKLIEYKLRAMRLIKDTKIYDPSYFLSYQLYALGFFEEGFKFAEVYIKNNNDSSVYYLGLEAENMNSGNYKAAHEYSLKRGGKDNIADWWCTANILLRLRDFKGSLSIVDSLDKYGGPNIQLFKKDGKIIPWYYVGYTYHKNGLKEKAAFHFNGVIKEQQKIINENTGRVRGYAYLNLVFTYSAMGDKAKAIENMKKMLEHKDEIPVSPVAMLEFRNHPMCDIIRDTPEHKEILTIAEERFQPVKKDIESQLEEFFN